MFKKGSALLPLFVAAFVALFAFEWKLGAKTDHAPAATIADQSATEDDMSAPTAATPNDDVIAAPAQVIPVAAPTAPPFAMPVSFALDRVTKKPFGLHVTKADSPVQPERFGGFHVGTDFEMLPGEEDVTVTVYAVCDGPLALKKRATGYGGVAVQRCALDGRDVTVVYGHLQLASVRPDVGTALRRGERVGILGRGFSAETDGERKHLHLGVHEGRDITLKGYVATKDEMTGWIDAAALLR